MTDQRISEITARCEAATTGPWAATGSGADIRVCHTEDGKCVCCLALMGKWDETGTPTKETSEQWEGDAAFIARAREDIPYLLSQLAECAKQVEMYKKAMEGLAEICTDRDAEIERLREAQRWTDTEYDTPDIGQAVLLYMPDKETDNIRAGEYMGEGDYRIGNKLYRGMEIDAWLPLPALPEEGANT